MNDQTDQACEYTPRLILQLTLLLLFTSAGTFALGNILLLNYSAFAVSSQMLVAAITIILTTYTLANITRSYALGTTITFLLLCASIVLDIHQIKWLVYCLGVYGVVSLYIETARHKDIMNRRIIQASLMGALVTISAKSVTSFDMIDRLYTGTAHRDTLFHASLASMIQNYGTVSTGLNGLVETPYHILSHILFSAIGNIASTGILETYGTAQFLLMIPMLIGTIAYTTAVYSDKEKFYKYFMLTAFTLAIAPRLFNSFGIKESYFGSESYTLGLILLLISLPSLIRKKSDARDWTLLVITIPLMILAKSSVGAIFIGLVAVKVILHTSSRLERTAGVLLVIYASVMAIVILSPMLGARLHGQSVEYWQYVKCCSALGKYATDGYFLLIASVLLFIAVHFLFTWVTIHQRRKSLALGYLRTILQDRVSSYSFAAAAGGLLAVALPVAYGSSGYYFSNIAMFVSLPWFIGTASNYRLPGIKHTYIIGMVFILLFKSSKLVEKSSLDRNQTANEDTVRFISKLLEIRDTDFNGSSIYTPSMPSYSDQINPFSDCEARPHVYPAVSERAWVGLLNADQNCFYVYYENETEIFKQADDKTEQYIKFIPADMNIISVDFSN